MRILLLSVLTAIAMFGIRARDAEASCLAPSRGFSPLPGTIVPARGGTVYLFAPAPAHFELERSGYSKRSLEVDIEVKGARFRARVVASSRAYSVVRVDYYEVTGPGSWCAGATCRS